MIEFGFYSTFSEAIELLREIHSVHSLRIHFAPRDIVTDGEIEELSPGDPSFTRRLAACPRVWLTGSFSTEPLGLRRVVDGPHAGKLVVDMRRGGPAMRLGLPSEEGLVLSPGGLEYADRVFLADRAALVPASAAIARAFENVTATLRGKLVEHSISLPDRLAKGWVTTAVRDRYREGAAGLRGFGRARLGLPISRGADA